MNEKMTVKEVSEVLGYEYDTIRKKVKELFPDCVKNGVTTFLDENQVNELKKSLVPRTLALKSEVEDAITETEMIEKTHQVFMWLTEKVKTIQSEKELLQIELDEHKKWYSIKRVQLMGYFKDKDPRELWKPLKEYSIIKGYQIKTIFDANYGNVKVYHADVFKAVYGIDFDQKQIV